MTMDAALDAAFDRCLAKKSAILVIVGHWKRAVDFFPARTSTWIFLILCSGRFNLVVLSLLVAMSVIVFNVHYLLTKKEFRSLSIKDSSESFASLDPFWSVFC